MMQADVEEAELWTNLEQTTEVARWGVEGLLAQSIDPHNSAFSISHTLAHTLYADWDNRVVKGAVGEAVDFALQRMRTALTISELIEIHVGKASESSQVETSFQSEEERKFFFDVDPNVMEQHRQMAPPDNTGLLRWFAIYHFYRTAALTEKLDGPAIGLRLGCTLDTVNLTELRRALAFWRTVVAMGSVAAAGYVYPPFQAFLDVSPLWEKTT